MKHCKKEMFHEKILINVIFYNGSSAKRYASFDKNHVKM